MGGWLKNLLIAGAGIAFVGFCFNHFAEQKRIKLEERVADARADAMADAEANYAESAQIDAQEELSGSTYVEEAGYLGCTYNCSGHEAGFSFAIEHQFTDASECDGASPSFVEGCEAYVEALEALTAEKLESKKEEMADEAEDEIRSQA